MTTKTLLKMAALAGLLAWALPAHAGKFSDLQIFPSSGSYFIGYPEGAGTDLTPAKANDAVLTSSGAAVVQSTSATAAHRPFRVKNNAGTDIFAVTQAGALIGVVDGSNLASSSVDTAKLATDSVIGTKILNATIDTAKLNATIQAQLANVGTVAAGSIDTAKLATDSVIGAKILNGVIDTRKLSFSLTQNNQSFDLLGLFVQFGQYTGGANSPTITWPTAFSTLLWVGATCNTSSDVNGCMVTVIGTPTTSSAVMDQTRHDATNLTDNFYWMAIGKR